MNIHYCNRCKRQLPVEKFSKQTSAPTGLSYACKDCYKQYFKDNAERIKKRAREYHIENTEKISKKIRDKREARPAVFLLHKAKERATKFSLPFSIVEADVQVPEFCPILNVKLVINKGTNGPDSPTLDRIIPELGYTPENIQVISHRANQIKNDASIEELELIIAHLKKLQAQKTGLKDWLVK